MPQVCIKENAVVFFFKETVNDLSLVYTQLIFNRITGTRCYQIGTYLTNSYSGEI